LLLTGKPGTGKSSLIHSVARQLAIRPVIEWAVSSRTTLQDGLYHYDALARLQYIQQHQARAGERAPDDASELGKFLALGPLGSALATRDAPCALLVDEIDKSDVDFPNDLLNVLDTGHFVIPELKRVADLQPSLSIPTHSGERVEVLRGEITFTEFPFIVMTSTGERDFPAPFLRRCVQCAIPEPSPEELEAIVVSHFGLDVMSQPQARALVADFVKQRGDIELATDQLLNAIHLMTSGGTTLTPEEHEKVVFTVFQGLGG
jgi:MoxR-like ATPase